MFNLSYTIPCEIQGEIRVNKPVSGLGCITDVDGKRWDIRGIFRKGGETFVQAVLESELHPYYNDTSMNSYGFIEQTWKPYKIMEV